MLGRSSLRVAWCTVAYTALVSRLLAGTGDSFSFVVIADPHIVGDSQHPHSQRLQQCVDWVNTLREQKHIDLVFVVGDIGFGAGGANLQTAKSILDGLNVPYAPILGDNELECQDEQNFATTFEPIYQSLEALAQDPGSGLSNWQKAPVQVWNPEIEDWSYFQSFAFDYGGVHFLCLDWCSRNDDPGEDADLHAFAGGTWPWFTTYVAGCTKDKQENLVMLTHHPMHTLGGWLGEALATAGTFSPIEFEQVSEFLNDPNHNYADYVSVAYAGHYHCEGFLPQNADPNRIEMPEYGFDPNAYDPNGVIQFLPLPGYDLHVVDATWDDQNGLELITVTEGESGFSYDSRFIPVGQSYTLTIGYVGGQLGDVHLDPEPNDPNLPAYPAGMEVTLTAVPSNGKEFKHYKLYDPNFPGDGNHAVLDANPSTVIVMDADREVTAVFKCGSGVDAGLPLLAIGLLVLSIVSRCPGLPIFGRLGVSQTKSAAGYKTDGAVRARRAGNHARLR